MKQVVFRIRKIVVLMVLAITFIACSEKEEPVKTTIDETEFKMEGNTLVSYKGNAKELVIPDEIDGVQVKVIGYSAFSGIAELERVTIPEGVTRIDTFAFRFNRNLVEVSLPDSLISIGEGAFGSCDRLTTFNIPKGLKELDKPIAHVVEGQLTRIEVDQENNYFSSIDGVLFNKDQTKLLGYPSYKSGNTYSIPAGVKEIGESAFYKNKFLTSVTIPDTVSVIEKAGLSTMNQLTSITVPEGVERVSHYAIFGNNSLTSISLPSTLTSVGIYAFAKNPKLTTITIPGNVKSFGYSMLAQTPSLTNIEVEPDNLVLKSVDGVLFDQTLTRLIKFPEAKNINTYTIPNRVKIIEVGAFKACKLTTITIPDSVEIIAYEAFANCKQLRSITIPGSVKQIDQYAFKENDLLQEVTLSEGVEEIESGAFTNIPSLKEVNIPSTMTIIERGAFNRSLSRFIVDEANSTFSSVDGVLFNKDQTVLIGYPDRKEDESYQIPNTVHTIQAGAFDNSFLKDVTIPESVNKIEEGAFSSTPRTVYMESFMPPQFVDTTSYFNHSMFIFTHKGFTIYVPCDSDVYDRYVEEWPEHKDTIQMREDCDQ